VFYGQGSIYSILALIPMIIGRNRVMLGVLRARFYYGTTTLYRYSLIASPIRSSHVTDSILFVSPYHFLNLYFSDDETSTYSTNQYDHSVVGFGRHS
jgi:hypothetical protein